MQTWHQWRIRLTLAAALTVAGGLRADVTNTGADVVPADCLAFSTSLKIKPQLETLYGSPAFQKNLVPLVKKIVAKVEAEGDQKAKEALAKFRSPEVQQALAVAFDLVGNECFSYVDHSWMDFFGKFKELPQKLQANALGSMIGGGKPDPAKLLVPPLVEFLVESKLKLPPIVLGGKPSDPQAIANALAKLPEAAGQGPVKVESADVNGSKFYFVKLTGAMLQIPEDKIVEALGEAGVSEQKAKDFYEYLRELTVTISVGVNGKYAILSIAADNDHLKRFGKAPFLCDHDALKPIRKHIASGKLTGMHYSSLELAKLGYQTAEEQKAEVEKGLAPLSLFLPSGLAPKLTKEFKQMIDDADTMTAKPSETVGCEIDNNGPETYEYTRALQPTADYKRPLAILAHAGGAPFLAMASSDAPSAGGYAKFVGYCQRFYGYFKEYGLTKMEGEPKEKYLKFESVILPALAELDAVTGKKFIPAVDAGQSMFVVDAKSKAKEFPEGDLPEAMPVPELALAMSINDGDLLRQAVVDYVQIVERTYEKLVPILKAEGASDDLPAKLPLMAPTGKAMGDVTQYHYPLPFKLDAAILPHVVLGKKFLAFSSSPGLSQRMLTPTAMASDGVVALDQASSSGGVVRMPTLLNALKEWVELAKKAPDGPFQKHQGEEKQMIEMGVNSYFDVLGMFKHTSVRVHKEGDYHVTHTWTKIDLSGN